MAFVTCYLFGSLLVPKLTFSVPFFGVKEKSDHFPTPALFGPHFSQVNQSPAAQVSQAGPGFRPTVAAPIPELRVGQRGQLVLVARNNLDGRFPTFRCSTTSSLTEHGHSRRFCWVDLGSCLGSLSVVLKVCSIAANIEGCLVGFHSLMGPHVSHPMAR